MPDVYDNDSIPCLVARCKCGLYVAAFGLEAKDLTEDTQGSDALRRFIKECNFAGAEFEIRPVSFVRNGGLTFDHACVSK
jgi:hypothetical protein